MTRTLIEKGMSQQTGKTFHIDLEYRLRRADGSYCWLYDSTTACLDDQGELECFFGSAYDITERKHAETVQSQYSAIIESSSDAIISKTMDSIITSWNPAAEKMFGYTAHEILGQSMTSLMPPDRAYEEDQILSRIRRGERIEHFETILLKKTKDNIHVSVNISPIMDVSGIIIGASKIVHDITDRKQAEDDKHALEQQCLHTQKLESLGVLAGGIAHDFNNILTIIMGNCSLAMMDNKNAKDYIPKIESAAERAAGLCRQMLAYAGKAQLSKTQVNMSTLVDEMINMLKSTIPQNVVIKANLDSDTPVITADSSQIRQIIMNMIINASEAIGTTRGEIRVSLTKTVIHEGESDKDFHGNAIPPGEYACLEVTDTGCGMNEETKSRIFEPFYTTKFTGRGLGMSAVLGIIVSHNGALHLCSYPGKGTTLKVYLPISDGFAGDQLHQQIVTEYWQGSGTILLVEDEEQVKLIASMVLRELGFAVIEASNGKEALELYQRNAGDIFLVVTDLDMPVMDGYELVSELKRFNPDLPIVISSGFGDADVSSKLDRNDIAEHISKPYNFNQLREMLKKVLADAKQK